METISLALAMPSGDIATGLIELVERHPLLELCGVARTPEDMRRILRRFHPDVLLLSPHMLDEMEEESWEGEEEAYRVLTPTFLVIGGELSLKKRELLNFFRQPFAFCGAVDLENTNSESLYTAARERVGLLRKVAAGNGLSKERDRPAGPGTITLISGKGGVGNTLLASSLAAFYAGENRRVLLADLDKDRSQLSLLKPIGEGKTLAELLPLAEEISWELVRISMFRHPAGFYLLPFGNRDRVEKEGRICIPSAFFRNLGFLFDLVIVDLPGNLVEDFLPVLLPSRAVALVSLADSISARCSRAVCHSIRRLGVEPRRLHLVINRYGRSASLHPHELSRAIGIDNPCLLPDDPRSGLDFAELGRLPRPDSALGKAISTLADLLEGDSDHPSRTSSRPNSPLTTSMRSIRNPFSRRRR